MRTKDRAHRALLSRLTDARARIRAERNLIGWRRDQRTPLAVDLDLDRLPVIFCTWRRLGRLRHTLAQLAAQDIPVQVLIWNNSPDRASVDAVATTAGIPVTVHHSPRNIGGFGRFYLAREAAEAGHRSVVFIDDDQNFGPETVRDLLSGYRPHSLSGWWAFRFTGAAYGDRVRSAPGDDASYVGTGGMVADAAVFCDSRLFECPRRFWFAEDLWLSYVAAHLCGFDLYRSPAQFEAVQDGHALYLSLGRTKWKLQRYLIRRGWTPVRDGTGRAGDDRGSCGELAAPDPDPR
jgi:hypothetical protein